MDVTEFLAQKKRNRTERAALDEPEFVLTASEFDYRLRKAFADRERNVEKQVRKMLDDHMRAVESKIADEVRDGDNATGDALAEMRKQLRAEVAAIFESPRMNAIRDAIAQLVVQRNAKLRDELRAEFSAELASLRADLTIANAHAGERSTIIDLPSSRRAG